MNNKEIDKQIKEFDKFLKKTDVFIKKSEEIIEDWMRSNPEKEEKMRKVVI